MLIQSTVPPLPRICVLLGGPQLPAPSVQPKLAALFRPANRSLQVGRTP